MRKISKTRQALIRHAKPIRDKLRSDVGRCEVCGKRPSEMRGVPADMRVLDIHEIGRGPCRAACLDKLFALLVVCRSCHDELDSAKLWPEARQLALLAEKRIVDWDLVAYLETTSPRAPRRIELEEVVAYMSDELLKVDEVADRMRVNRRTAQSWIDSKQLPAIDVRPTGAERAMWRVQPDDLLAFAQRRKSGGQTVTLDDGEDLLD